MAIKLSKQQQQYLAVGVVGLGAFIFCYVKFFWLPISKKIDDVNGKIAGLDRDIQAAQRQAARLPDLEKLLVSLNERKLEADKRLPEKKFVTDILVTVGGLAKKNRVALTNFAPGPTKKQQYFIELRYPVSVKGSFHNIGKFLAALALEQRLYNVYDVAYSEPAGDTGEMAVTFTLASYYREG